MSASQTIQTQGLKSAKSYQTEKNWLLLASVTATLIWLALSLVSGISEYFRNIALSISGRDVWVVFLYFLFFSVYFLLVDLPIDFYSGFLLEHRYGLSNESFAGWAFETTKKAIVFFLIASLLIEGLYFLIRRFDSSWWLFAWGGWFLFTVILGKVGHLVLLPLFYKTEELKDPGLRDRVVRLAKTHGLGVKEVYSINLSKTTKKANAAFCGFGNTKRVLLSDTLIEQFDPDEIETVLAHEIGHYKRHHIMKHLLFGALVSLATFYVAFRCVNAGSVELGFEGPNDLAAFPLLGLVSFSLSWVLLPVGNFYSRLLETEADDFAVKATGMRQAFTGALQKLAKVNLADPSPHPLIEFFLYSHPSIAKRVERAQAADSKIV